MGKNGLTISYPFSIKDELRLSGLSFDIQVDRFVGLTISRYDGIRYKPADKRKAIIIEGEIESTWTYKWEGFVTKERYFLEQTS